MKYYIIKSILIVLTSDFLIAGSCANGFCGISLPHIPTEMQDNTQIKPFNASYKNKETTRRKYHIWGLIDNGGDNITGKNRLMSGANIYSLLDSSDTLSLFGLATNENLTSGKISYAYTLPWYQLILELSYINSNYSLGEPIPGATGLGKTQTIEGKITYPFVDTEKEKINFSLSFSNNNIKEKINDNFTTSRNKRNAYLATAAINFESQNYALFYQNTKHKLSLGITTGKLKFDNVFNEKIDKLGANTQGTYTKINIDYKSIISFSNTLSLEANFKSQYALNNKNLDDSESFTIGGMNGVKLFEEGSAYDSNGFLFNIEGKYVLPEVNSFKNSLGIFYDYGKVWESNSLVSNERIAVKDAGVGLYSKYKKFFSKIQLAYKIQDSKIPTKDDKNYRALFQMGLVF